MDKNKHSIKELEEILSNGLNSMNSHSNDDSFEELRAHKRITVIWPAIISIKEYQLKCILYNLSLGGARVKLNLPLALGAPLHIKIKDFDTIKGVVSYRSKEYLGLSFSEDPENVKSVFGYHADKLM